MDKDTIEHKLETLFHTNPSTYMHLSEHAQRTGEGTYQLAVSNIRGGIYDMLRVYEYLQRAGLSVGDNDVSQGDGAFYSLGYGDGKGGYVDRVPLSENVTLVAALPDAEDPTAFKFEIRFDQEPQQVKHLLDEAIRLAKMENHLQSQKKAGETKFRDRLNGLDRARDGMAMASQFAKGNDDARDVKIVEDFVRSVVTKRIPGAEVDIQYDPAPDYGVQVAYGISKPTFAIRITLPGEGLRAMDERQESALMHRIEDGLQEKIPSTRTDFVRINGARGNNTLTGYINGSAARIAAEIEGRVPKVVRRNER